MVISQFVHFYGYLCVWLTNFFLNGLSDIFSTKETISSERKSAKSLSTVILSTLRYYLSVIVYFLPKYTQYTYYMVGTIGFLAFSRSLVYYYYYPP